MLTENGVKVVGLESGPWRGRETFGGDELANINRYNLWPDPLLNPRTSAKPRMRRRVWDCFARCRRSSAEARSTGGLVATVNAVRLPHSLAAGDIDGATLADWPISYDELEPYYAKVEWEFGVSGLAGANKFEGPRSKGYPTRRLVSRFAEKFYKGCRARRNTFPTPQAALCAPTTDADRPSSAGSPSSTATRPARGRAL